MAIIFAAAVATASAVTSAQLEPQTLLRKTNDWPAELDNRVERNSAGLPGVSPEQLISTIADGLKRNGGFGDKWSIDRLTIDWTRDQRYLVATFPYRRDGVVRTGIFLVDIRSQQLAHLADGSRSHLSPDGTFVAFLDVDNRFRIAQLRGNRLELAEGEQDARIDADAAQVFDFAWSPDSKRLVYAAIAKPGAQASESDRVLGLYDVTNGTRRILYRTQQEIGGGISWTSRGILFAHRQYGNPRGVGRYSDYWGEILLLNPANGQIDLVANKSGYSFDELSPSISPDGRKVAFGYDPFQVPPVGSYILPAIHNLSSGETTVFPLERNFALALMPARWRGGSREVLYRCKTEGLYSAFCIIDSTTGAMRRVDIDPLRDLGAPSISPFDGRIAWLSESVYGDIRLTVAARDLGKRTDVRLLNRYGLEHVALGQVQSVRWSSGDGLHLGGLLVLPVNYVQGRRYPLIVDIHGGPVGGITLNGGGSLTGRALEWQVWAAKGYAVLVADYRKGGTAGVKDAYVRRIDGFEEDGDVADVLSGIDEVVRLGVVDPARIGAVGHSYGGIVLDWLVIKSGRLNAAIVHEGLPAWWDGKPANAPSQSEAMLAYRRWFMGTDEANRSRIEAENEPISYANRISTPLLWISGAHSNVDGNLNVPRLYVRPDTLISPGHG